MMQIRFQEGLAAVSLKSACSVRLMCFTRPPPSTRSRQIEAGSHITTAVTEVTDSQYVQRAMTQHLRHWIARGWLNSRGTPVSNQDLWNALLRESGRHQVTWSWVRGHGASAEQNRCDKLAQAAARSLMVAF
jgi:ribonuclease HI